MGTFSFSATAEAGGSLNQYSLGKWDQAELSAGKYIVVYQQSVTLRYFARVVNLFDAVGPPTFGVQQTVLSSAAAIRDLFVFALSDTKAVVMYYDGTNLAMHVLNIDSDLITVGTVQTFTDANLGNQRPTARFVSGVKRLDAVGIDATTFYVWHTNTFSSATTWQLSRFSVSGDTITLSNSSNSDTVMTTWNHSIGLTANYTWKISKALTASEFIIQSGRSIGVIGTTSNEITDLSDSGNDTAGVTLEIATDEYVHIRQNHFLRYYKSGVWGRPLDFSVTNSSNVKDAFRMSDTHFGVIQSDGTNPFIQFVRKINDEIWQHQGTSGDDRGFDIFTTVITVSNWWEGSSRTTGELGEMVYTIDANTFAVFHSPTSTNLEMTVIQSF